MQKLQARGLGTRRRQADPAEPDPPHQQFSDTPVDTNQGSSKKAAPFSPER
jgi:hypothetical protein